MCSIYDAQKQALTHPEDCLCDDCQREACPKLVIDRERGASRSDVASGQAPKFLSGLPVATPENTGAESSNTAPSNLQSHLLSFPDTSLSTGGMDYLSLTCYGEYDPSYWETLREKLVKGRKSAEENNSLDKFLLLAPGIMVEVAPSGKGSGFSYCKWKFKYQGFVFGIGDLCSSRSVGTSGEKFNLTVDVSSLPFMTFGEMGVYDEIRSIYRALKYIPYKSAPSRVDLCVDLIDVPVSGFVKAFEKEKYVSKVKKNTITSDGLRAETLKLGSNSSKTILRIYDKDRECKDDSVKRELLVSKRWGKEPDPELGATRVEFQIRREHLRERHEVHTYEDFIKKRNSLVQWLTNDWFRLTEEEPDGNHTERFGPSELWCSVIRAFDSWTGQTIQNRGKRKVVGSNPEQLILQAKGCLVSALAAQGIHPKTPQELQGEIAKAFAFYNEVMLEEIPERRKHLEANFPYAKLHSENRKAS